MTQALKISIITVAYNSAATLGDTLKSVAVQNHPEVEHILVDGGSIDGTSDLVSKNGGHLAKFISEPDRGIYDAMNKGLSLATGEIIGLLNSDDFYVRNNVLEEVASIFTANPDLDVVMGSIDFVEGGDLHRVVRRVTANKFSPWMMRFGFMPPHPAVFIRKSTYERIGPYKINYKIAADFELLVRLFLIDRAKYKIVPSLWVRMRTGGASTSGWHSKSVITKEMLMSLSENGIYSSRLILILRLPIKFFKEVFLTRVMNHIKN